MSFDLDMVIVGWFMVGCLGKTSSYVGSVCSWEGITETSEETEPASDESFETSDQLRHRLRISSDVGTGHVVTNFRTITVHDHIIMIYYDIL